MPELLIAAGLLVLVGAVLVIGLRRRPRPPAAPPEPEEARERPAMTTAAPVPAEVVERPGLRERLRKSRKFLADRLSDALGPTIDDETWDELEAVLIQADIGAAAATEIIGDLENDARERKISDPAEVKSLLTEELAARFDPERERTLAFAPSGPTVWLIVGVNGTGKTTTIGKLAADLRNRGRSVALAAADTFRAAADEQLEVWAERSGAVVVKHQPGADPGAVAYDAHRHARAKQIDVLIVDTAGRLHTKSPLMDELAKVRRVIEKEGRVHEVLLVIDATGGQNGLNQARVFADAAGVSGVVLTKLDGTAKGGIAVAIEDSLGIPIKLIGVGEQLEDIEPFDPKRFVDALLA